MWPFCSFEPEGAEIEMKIEKMRLCPCCVSRPQMVKSVQATTQDITKARAEFPKSSQLFDAISGTKVGTRIRFSN
jgi:hypothetical protein